MASTSRTLHAPAGEAEPLPGGWWRLNGRGRRPWELYLRDPGRPSDPAGADDPAGGDERLALPTSAAIWVEWHGDAVRWRTAVHDAETWMHATAGLLHEPCGRLYATLPLARYDSRARRYWGAVLWAARWPPARGLFGWLARRHRSNDTA